jgi:hypothetical protein
MKGRAHLVLFCLVFVYDVSCRLPYDNTYTFHNVLTLMQVGDRPSRGSKVSRVGFANTVAKSHAQASEL